MLTIFAFIDPSLKIEPDTTYNVAWKSSQVAGIGGGLGLVKAVYSISTGP